MPHLTRSLEMWLVAGGVVATCVLFTRQAADPVNVIKLTALVMIALALVVTWTADATRSRVAVLPTGPPVWAAAVLLIALGLAASAAPVTTTAIVGTYGRNSGLLAYAAGLVLFLACLRSCSPSRAHLLLGAVCLSGLFTSTYGLLQLGGIDAIPWRNPDFNPIIAALGNPNFASGYLGVTAPVALGAAMWSGWGMPWRAASAVTGGLCLLAALLSGSAQGPIAAAAGLLVVAVPWVLTRVGRRKIAILSAIVNCAIVGAAVLALGLSGRGPAASLRDAGSTARFHYWGAAIEMFEDAPLRGVGLDQYGNFWRSSRSAESLQVLSGSDYSDAAHSVQLQMLAQGGALLAAAYAVFLLITALALVHGLRRAAGADRPLIAAIGGGWTAYQVQSAVSIDQVPLIVLHFVLAGGVIAVSGRWPVAARRLPGAPPMTARSGKPARDPARASSAADAAVVTLVALAALALLVPALRPLRANMAALDGNSALLRGDGNAGLTAYEQATSTLPGENTYWLLKGSLFSQVQRADLSMSAYQEAVDRNDRDAVALRELAREAETAGDLGRARGAYDRLLEIDPWNVETRLASATFELRHSGAREAQRLLERALDELPPSAGVWAALGDAYLVLENKARAEEAYARALALDPANPVALKGMATINPA